MKNEETMPMNKGAKTMRKRFTSQIPLTSLLVGVLLISSVQGQSFFNASLLGRTWQGNARAMALGHVGTTESFGMTNLFTNPALLTDGPGLRLEGGFNSAHRMESRSYPMMDQFEDVVTENIYNITESWQTNYNGGGVWSNGTLAVGAGMAPYWSPFFRYREDVRGNLSASNFNRDPLVGTFQLDRSGLVNETVFGMSAQLRKFHFGVSVGLLSGSNLNTVKGTTVLRPDAALDTDTTNVTTYGYELDKATMVYRLGVSFDMTKRIRLAWNTESSAEMTFKSVTEVPFMDPSAALPGYLISDTTMTIKQTQPSRMTLGVRLQPTNLLRTKAYFEVEFIDWSQFKIAYPDSISGQGELTSPLSQSITLRGGVEHELFNGMPIRAGLIYAGSPLAKNLAQTWITFGSGYQYGNLIIDVAGEFGNVIYTYPDLFVVAGQTHQDDETIHESTTKFALTLAYVFK